MLFAKVAGSSNRISAPLWTWVLAVTLALLFLGISYFRFYHADAFDYFNPKRLERFSISEGQKTLRVAVIGTSLTCNAFYKDEEMERFANDRGLKIRFLRFTMNSGRLEEFYDLSQAVINSGADMIFFEAALFGLDLGNTNQRIDRYRRYLRHGGTRLLARLPFASKRHRPGQNANYTDLEFIRLPFNGQDSEMEAKKYRKIVSSFRIRDYCEGGKFVPLIQLAGARGKTIVFLDLPRSGKAWGMLPAGFAREFDRTMGQYETGAGISFLRFPQRLPLDYFQDLVHFNAVGRKLYSGWFLNQLVPLSEKAGK